MKAILYRPSSGAALCEVPVPTISDAEALIAVDACGLCGTDLMKLSSKPPQAVLGHEIAGRIHEVGRKVKGFAKGDRVILAHHVPCLDCHYCKRGSYSMCRQFKATNVEPGGFSELVRASELHVKHALFKIPDGLDAIAASQTEPLSCCLRNVKRLKTGEGDTVGIIGLGAVGLMTAQLLKSRKVSVLGLDLDAARAEGLAPYGEGFTTPGEFEAAIRARTEGRGLDALIFTAGPASMVSERVGWLRDGGTLNIFASFHPSQAQLDLNAVYHRELTIMSSYSPAPEDLPESLELIASGAFSVEALKPKTFGLEEFEQAAREIRDRKILKAVLVPLVKAAK
jgi:L-iditol 2-dehydrogenase